MNVHICLLVFCFRNSTLRFERLSKIKFIIKASIYVRDKDQFELTKNLTPGEFKEGNQFDDDWFQRISRYVDHVVSQIYEEDLPHRSQLIIATSIKTVKGKKIPGENYMHQTKIRRDFDITVLFSQDDMPHDIPFF